MSTADEINTALGRFLAREPEIPFDLHDDLRIILNAAGQAARQCCQCNECRPHTSDCAVHNEPAYPNGPCDCRDLEVKA